MALKDFTTPRQNVSTGVKDFLNAPANNYKMLTGAKLSNPNIEKYRKLLVKFATDFASTRTGQKIRNSDIGKRIMKWEEENLFKK